MSAEFFSFPYKFEVTAEILIPCLNSSFDIYLTQISNADFQIDHLLF